VKESYYLNKVLSWLGINELFDSSGKDGVMGALCGYLPHICEALSTHISTSNTEIDDSERFAVYVGGHFPSGGSKK
jgi:hypothetical protein